jgi:hypothetical protein
VKTTAGMHRFAWDMHYDPIPSAGGGGRGGGDGNGAVPHRTYPGANAPWVAPGTYTVRMSVNGKTQTQPITIKMDPRVKITPEVQQIFTLTTQMETNARNAAAAYKEARAAAEKTKDDALRKQLDEIAPVESADRGGGGRGGAPPEAPPAPNLANIGGRMVGAAMSMQVAEMAPTATQLEACTKQQAAYTALMAKWTALKAKINAPADTKQ